jgi:hypothetical protein
MAEDTGRSCLFCGNTPVTREHVWPKWLQDVLPNYTRTANYIHQVGDEEPRTWSAPIASMTVNVVCESCNGGWMSRLETAAKPLLVPMINGRRTTLDKPQQRTIATWTLKTTMMLEQMDPEPVDIHPKHYPFLYEHGEPPATAWVWIGANDATRWHTFRYAWGLDLHVQEFPGADPNGYVATLAVRHLGLQVIGSDIPDAEWEHAEPFASSVQRIWPFAKSFMWPPGPVLTERGLMALAEHWRGGR